MDAAADREQAVAAATAALRAGRLVVVPTDTVYGVAADAFNPLATAAVFTAKRRDRTAPLPVLVRSPKQVLGLVTALDEGVEHLMAAWWPGPLTIVVRAEPNLAWDLGDNRGTVALRMPFDDVTLSVIRAIGPLAVTSANLSGNPAATSAALARAQLGEAVAVYVDDGARTDTTPSTIVDMTRAEPAILRQGPLDPDEVLAVARGELAPHEATPWDPAGDVAGEQVGAASAGAGPGEPGQSSGPTEHATEEHAVGPASGDEGDARSTRRPPSRHVARDHRAG